MELKPCPFCGSVANVHSVGDGDSYVLCQSCDTLSPKDGTPEYVAQNWNNRPLEDALRAQSVKDAARIAELEATLSDWKDECLAWKTWGRHKASCLETCSALICAESPGDALMLVEDELKRPVPQSSDFSKARNSLKRAALAEAEGGGM